MLHDVVAASYVGEYRLRLTFDDGKSGVVDFAKYLSRGGVFSRFHNEDFFRSFVVNDDLGTVTWGDKVDVAPERLYSEATGAPVPHWADWATSPRDQPSDGA